MATKKKRNKGSKSDQLESVLEHIGPEFIGDGAKRVGLPDLRGVLDSAETLESKFSGSEALDRFAADVRLMLSLLRDFRTGSYTSVGFWSISIIVFILGYVLKPVDIIPDSLPRIGQLDDALVVSHGLAMVTHDLHAYKIWTIAHEVDG